MALRRSVLGGTNDPMTLVWHQTAGYREEQRPSSRRLEHASSTPTEAKINHLQFPVKETHLNTRCHAFKAIRRRGCDAEALLFPPASVLWRRRAATASHTMMQPPITCLPQLPRPQTVLVSRGLREGLYVTALVWRRSSVFLDMFSNYRSVTSVRELRRNNEDEKEPFFNGRHVDRKSTAGPADGNSSCISFSEPVLGVCTQAGRDLRIHFNGNAAILDCLSNWKSPR